MTGQQYGTRAERRSRRSSISPKLIAGVAAIALAGGAGAYALMSGSDDTEQADGSRGAPCASAQIPIAVDPSLSAVLTQALMGYSGGKGEDGCARSYSVLSVTNRDLVRQMSSGSPTAQLWVTESPRWFSEASKVAKTTITPAAPFAATPVVISAPTEQMPNLGTPTSSWQKLLKAKPQLTLDDASNDRASLLALTRAAQALGQNTTSKAAMGSLATTTRGSIPGDAPHVTTEAALTSWNKDNPTSPLSETALQDGSPLVTLQAAPLVSGDPGTNAALKEITTYLSSGKGHDVLAAAGYRTPDGHGVPSGAPSGSNGLRIGATPPPEAVEQTLTSWEEATKPLRMTAVFDVSGSMAASTNGVSRAAAVSQTALKSLDVFPSSTRISFWEFSTGRDGNKDYKVLVPMGSLSDPSHMAKLRAAAKGLPKNLGGDTGLYDTIWAAYEAAQKDFTEGSISSVTVLTDGRNDDSTGGLSLEELKTKLTDAADPKRPVRVTTITIGGDVDTEALTEIANITNGGVYSAKGANDVGQVLAESLFDRRKS